MPLPRRRQPVPQPPAGGGDQQLTAALSRSREDERDEREERRGLENRASALLAAGAAVIGLVANGLQGLNVSGADRDRLLVTAAVASGVMAIAMGLLARALTLKHTQGTAKADMQGLSLTDQVHRHQAEAVLIADNNLRMLWWLQRATWTFAASLALFLVVVVVAGFTSSPPAAPSSASQKNAHGG